MNKKKKMSDRDRTFLLITIPILLLFFCFNTLPLLKGFLYSFTNFKGYGSYDFVKLRNYIDLFQDARVGKSYLFTFKFALVSTILVNVLSLILALGLNSRIKGKSALRGIYFIPNVPVSYTHLDVYKRQVLQRMPDGPEQRRRILQNCPPLHSVQSSDKW